MTSVFKDQKVKKMMKKILIFVLLVLFCTGSAFGGSFEDALKSAEQGDVTAQGFVGVLYHNGEGAPQDYKQAFYWYKKAAEQGSAGAQYLLGMMYYNGEGVTQNYKTAYAWVSIAAVQGDKNASEERVVIAKTLNRTTQQLSQAQELAAQMFKKINK